MSHQKKIHGMVYLWFMTIFLISVLGTSTDEEKCSEAGGILLSPFTKHMNLSMKIHHEPSDGDDNESTTFFDINHLPDDGKGFMICVDRQIIKAGEFKRAISKPYPEYQYVPGTKKLGIFFSKSVKEITTASTKSILFLDYINPDNISWKYRAFIVMNENAGNKNWTLSKNDVTLKMIVVDEKNTAFGVIDCQFNAKKFFDHLFAKSNLKESKKEFESKYEELKTAVEKHVEKKLINDEFSVLEAIKVFPHYKELWIDEDKTDELALELRFEIRLEEKLSKDKAAYLNKIQQLNTTRAISTEINCFRQKYQYQPGFHSVFDILSSSNELTYKIRSDSWDTSWIGKLPGFQKVRQTYEELLNAARKRVLQVDPPNSSYSIDQHIHSRDYNNWRSPPKTHNDNLIVLYIFIAIAVFIGVVGYGISSSYEDNDQPAPDLWPEDFTIKHKKSERIESQYDRDQNKSGEDFNSQILVRKSNSDEQSSISIKHCDEIQFPDNFEAIKKMFNQEIVKSELDDSQKRELLKEFPKLTSEFDRDELITHMMKLLQKLKAETDTKKTDYSGDQIEENLNSSTESSSIKIQAIESI